MYIVQVGIDTPIESIVAVVWDDVVQDERLSEAMAMAEGLRQLGNSRVRVVMEC